MAKTKEDQSVAYTYKVEGVTLNWCKLDEAVSPFGTLQHEMQIETFDKKEADEWRKNHLNVKEQESGSFTVGLKRKAQNADGSMKPLIKVVDAKLNPIDITKIKIANGSKGNVIIYVYPYQTPIRSGWASSLNSVQITKLIEYTGGEEFSVVETEDELNAKKTKAKSKTKDNAEFDIEDEIPF